MVKVRLAQKIFDLAPNFPKLKLDVPAPNLVQYSTKFIQQKSTIWHQIQYDPAPILRRHFRDPAPNKSDLLLGAPPFLLWLNI